VVKSRSQNSMSHLEDSKVARTTCRPRGDQKIRLEVLFSRVSARERSECEEREEGVRFDLRLEKLEKGRRVERGMKHYSLKILKSPFLESSW